MYPSFVKRALLLGIALGACRRTPETAQVARESPPDASPEASAAGSASATPQTED
jgi:hypothetical protein